MGHGDVLRTKLVLFLEMQEFQSSQLTCYWSRKFPFHLKCSTYDVEHCSQTLSTDLYQENNASSGQWDTKYIIFMLSGAFKTSGGRSLCSSFNKTAVALSWCRTHAKYLKVFVQLPREGNQWSNWQIIL